MVIVWLPSLLTKNNCPEDGLISAVAWLPVNKRSHYTFSELETSVNMLSDKQCTGVYLRAHKYSCVYNLTQHISFSYSKTCLK